MEAFNHGALELLTTGLWRSTKPLNRHKLGQLASLRGEMAPLIGPYEGYDVFLEGVRGLACLPVAGWSLFHVRLDDLVSGTPKSMVMALDIAETMQTKPQGGQGGAVLVVVETAGSLYLCLSTSGKSQAVLLSGEKFKSRPLNFAAALDPSLAAVALNILDVGPDDVLLDPCCGTGTILLGALERGAKTVGCDQSFKFSCGSRANLDYLGFASVGGGALRASANWNGMCAVAHHDARQSFSQEFQSLPTPTVLVTNVPHGRFCRSFRVCFSLSCTFTSLACSLARSLSCSLAESLSRCLAVSHSGSLALSLSRSLTLSPSCCLSLSLSRSLDLSLSRSLTVLLSHCLALSLSRSFSLSLSRSLVLFLSRARALSLSRSLALSLSRSLVVLHSRALSLFLSRSLALSLSHSPLALTLSLSLALSLFSSLALWLSRSLALSLSGSLALLLSRSLALLLSRSLALSLSRSLALSLSRSLALSLSRSLALSLSSSLALWLAPPWGGYD